MKRAISEILSGYSIKGCLESHCLILITSNPLIPRRITGAHTELLGRLLEEVIEARAAADPIVDMAAVQGDILSLPMETQAITLLIPGLPKQITLVVKRTRLYSLGGGSDPLYRLICYWSITRRMLAV